MVGSLLEKETYRQWQDTVIEYAAARIARRMNDGTSLTQATIKGVIAGAFETAGPPPNTEQEPPHANRTTLPPIAQTD